MGRASHAQAGGLTLSWALQQLNKQLGCGCSQGQQLAKVQPDGSRSAAPQPFSCLHHCQEDSTTSSCTSSQDTLSCLTPSTSDVCTHPARSRQQSLDRPRSSGPLSVRWAEALEQQTQRAHSPQHSHSTPDKPCLKMQQSSFPFLEEATQLEEVLLQPRASVLAQLNVDGGTFGSDAHLFKKRSRLAAFGQ